MNMENIFELEIPDGEIKHISKNSEIIWQRAIEATTEKAQSVVFANTRKAGGDGITYPAFTSQKVLPNVKAFGKTIEVKPQDTLWGRYLPVEYIESHGNEYIDTNIRGTNTSGLRIYVDTEGTSEATRTNTLICANGGAGAGQWFGVQSGVWTSGSGAVSNVPYNTRIQTIISFGTAVSYVLNGITYTRTGGIGELQGSTQLFYGIAGTQSYYCNAKLYACKIWNEDSLVRDFVPVRDSINNIYGLFDRVEKKFYGNDGTGTFTGGSEIKLLDYIQSNGSQYILPNLTGNVKWKIVAQGTKQNAQQVLLSSSQSAADATWLGEISTTGKWGIGDNVAGVIDVDTKATLDITFNSNGATGTINGFGIANTTAAVHNTWALGATSTGNYGFVGKIYSAQAEVDGTIVRDFIPILISGTPGLLDMSNWMLYKNAGAGSFVAGAEISNSTIVPYELIGHKGEIKYGQYGKNLFDKNNVNRIATIEPFIYIETTRKISSSSITSYEQDNSRTFYIKCEPNHTYTVSKAQDTTMRAGTTPNIPAFGNFVNDYVQATGTSLTITTSTNANYLIVQLYVNTDYNARTLNWNTIKDNLQIETGSQATSYEPYHFGIHADNIHNITLDGVTKSINDLLYSVNGYKDLQTGNVYNDWGLVVLNGTEDWKTAGAGEIKTFYVDIDTLQCNHSIHTKICSHFDYIGTVSSLGPSTLTETGVYTQSNIAYASKRIIIHFTTITNTVDAFKAWLSEQQTKGTPVIIIYPLANPTTTVGAADEYKLTTKGSKTTTTDVSGTTVEVTYLGE